MTFPVAAELQKLLDQCRPAKVLQKLQGEVPFELVIYKAKALLYLDRMEEASQLLEPALEHLKGDELALAKRYWSQILIHKKRVDEAIFAAQSAILEAQSVEMRAHAMVELATGYGFKACWQLAENALRDAKALVGPSDPIILLAESHLKLIKDERLAARSIYDQLAACDVPWAPFYAEWGRSTVALLLGDFEEARNRLEASQQVSSEMIGPYYLLAQLAIIDEDAVQLGQVVDQITQLSPQAEDLPALQAALGRLQKRQSTGDSRRQRLKAFPTTMQKRDYCGPSTIDLILRFWKSNEGFSDDQIAAYVKLPHGGTPAYRMQEFFHLVGFDTIRCIAPVEKLKQLIDAGYPVIVVEEFADNSHVSVVIGYDETDRQIEFQDPVTHQVVALPEEIVNRLRATFLNSAVVAFPHGQGHDKELARLGFFDEPSLIWTDQAELAMEKGQYQEVAVLMERAVQRLPNYPLSWLMWLSAELQSWQRAAQKQHNKQFSPVFKLEKVTREDEARKRFYKVLQRARELFPDSKFVYAFEGYGALQDGNARLALASFKKASEIDPDDSRNFAAMAECNFILRDVEQALDSAREAIRRNPAAPPGNLWMGRCLALRGDETAEHYARCALELAPNWGMAHLAMAEALLSKRDHPGARVQLDLAMAMDPQPSQARIQRAILASMDGYPDYAISELEETLSTTQRLPLYAEYNARQALCRSMFGRRNFNEAIKQVGKLLKLFPDDPWSLQFLASANSETLIRKQHGRSGSARRVRHWYDAAIKANKGITWIIADYLSYLARFESPQSALKEIERLCAEYPENKGLLALRARWMNRIGQQEPAARLMLEAVNTPGGIRDADDLYSAVQVILAGLGYEVGEQELLAAAIPEGAMPLIDRQRAVGLALALKPKEHGEHARELLEIVIKANPHDSYAIICLGDVTSDVQIREELYRRALRLAPNWPFARVYLANYLIDTGRAYEALGYTSGHQNESAEIMTANGRALYSLGRYEEAVVDSRAALDANEKPESWLYNNLWLAESRCGDHQAALTTARKALSRYPREVGWYSVVAASLRNLGRFYEAARVIQQGMMAGLKWPAYLENAYETALARGRFRTALQLEEKLAKWEKPSNGKYLNRSEERRFRLLLKLNRTDQARALLEGKPWLKSAEAWRTPIWICLDTSTWDLASEYAEKALSFDEQDFTGMFARAESLAETGNTKEAIVALNALQATHPYEHNSYEKLAIHHAIAGELDQAMEMAERAVLLGPFCPFAWATRGYVYFLRGQWTAARSDMETGWKRADFSRQRENFTFWWILAVLQNKPVLALYRRYRAWREARTDWRRQQITQVRNQMRQRAVERFRKNHIFA